MVDDGVEPFARGGGGYDVDETLGDAGLLP
jgi:hypothetical protein